MPTTPARWAWAPVLPAVVALAGVLLATASRYGYHRDELYFRLLPLRWGYVDQPPLLPALVHLTQGLADQVWALRLPAVLLGCASVLVLVAVTRELGGGPLAQGLTAWGYGFATLTLAFGHVLLTASVDLLVWPAILLAVLRVVLREDPRWWVLAGGLVGASTYAKWLVVVLVVAVLLGLLVAGPRTALRTRWLLAATGLALLLAAPNLAWQLRHGLPQLAMGRALGAENASDVRATLGPLLLVMVGPLVCWVWVVALVALVRSPRWRPVRFLAVVWLVAVALTFVGGSQFYYPYPVLAVVLAVGTVVVADHVSSAARRRGLLALVAVSVLSNVVINLPVLPVTVLARTPVPALNASVGEQVGWPALADQVDAVTRRARAADPGTVVLTSNYGEAGALARYSAVDVPVLSGHVALADAGPPSGPLATVVVVGGQVRELGDDFDACVLVTRLDNGVGLDNEEQGQPVSVCTGPRTTWADLWPRLRHLD